MGLVINGKPVDFNDASKYYNVSTVNYLAAGSCNFNDNGVSLWPLNQIVHDTQYYVRDAVIDYITAQGTVSPAIEGRLLFGDTTAPVITINAPQATDLPAPELPDARLQRGRWTDGTTPSFAAPSGVKSIQATWTARPVTSGQMIDLYTLSLGDHTLTVVADDFYGNTSTQSVTFSVTATIQSLIAGVNRFYSEGKIDNQGIANSLGEAQRMPKSLAKGQLKTAANQLNAFINEVQAQSGKHIAADAAALLIADAQWVIAHPK